MSGDQDRLTADELLDNTEDGKGCHFVRETPVTYEVAGEALMTGEDLLRLPRGEGTRYELIRGVLVEKMPTGDPHAVTTSLTSYFLTRYTFESGYGETRTGEPGYRLERDPDTVRAPDVAWIAPGHVPVGVQGYPELAPDLAVEVKSPSNSSADMGSKAGMWLRNGSQQVWVLNPESTIVVVHRPNAETVTLGEGDELEGGDLLPGFSVEVWRLFRRQR